MHPPDFRRELASPGAYSFAVSSVELRETHISWVFLAGDRAYKVKKPLALAFLDYSTAERRRFFCEEEVRLNERLAPRVYRRVVPITCTPSGRVCFEGHGEIVEHAVEMERLPERCMMDRLLARGEISNEPLDRLAETLAAFHARAATGPGVDEHGQPAAIAAAVLGNLDECGEQLESPAVGRLRVWLETFLGDRRALFAERVARRRIRDGHGDLHAGNVCFLPQRVIAYDCIEFQPAFRCGDVAADVAFLAMDLRARGFPGFGGYFAHRYALAADDPRLEELLPFYEVHRALVRSKVAAMRAAGLAAEPKQVASAEAESVRYLSLAAGRVAPTALIVTCGLPGTGKSTVARAIAASTGAAVLASDSVRKRLAGMQPNEHWEGSTDGGPYTREWTLKTYDALLDEARSRLVQGRSAVVDATFPLAEWRARFAALAESAGVPLRVVFLQADDATVSERLERRALDPREVSDAGIEVYRAAKQRFESPDEIPADRLVRLTPLVSPERAALRVVESLL